MEHGKDESEGQRMKVQLPPAPRDTDCSRMSAEEFHAHICRGYEDYLAGRVRPPKRSLQSSANAWSRGVSSRLASRSGAIKMRWFPCPLWACFSCS